MPLAQSQIGVTAGFVSEPRRQLSLAFMSPHPPILLGTISMVDSVILMIMALVVFGPRRLPQIGRQIGKLMYEFRKASNDFKFQMEEELRQSEEAERRRKEEERQRELAAQAVSEQASVSADPLATAATPESPYAGETTYPEQYPAETSSEEAKRDESTPIIMPPAVGETIAASRPNRAYGAPDQVPAIEEPGSSQQQSTGIADPASDSHSPEAAEALNPHG
jgi:sec-independent protein translocase protein TatB